MKQGIIKHCSVEEHCGKFPLHFTCKVHNCQKKYVCKSCFEHDEEHRTAHRSHFSNVAYLLETGLE